ncbi:type II toxin-antitoxin system Phd/YefM family antitoxin [Aerosakkonema sp. BLCC-F183]|uniref:type II toxin-antitoxin system Phd/YefM family antitoxin n=1 Tax=Aerosakkonema sp. BLCC-F183 TaxID=3342834 RepID=UPI0035BA1DDF
MTRITLAEAQLRLPEIIANLQPGEEVEILSGDRTVAKLVGELQPPRQPRQPRRPGSAIGTLTIISEDETYLEDFQYYMP